ncbi:RNA polymerase II transcription regulator recruiting protein [Aureococcus anophagefferens]|nr:RNA polymerase II transcription regulator recruiting protein [Aureococcus anophagefferens]
MRCQPAAVFEENPHSFTGLSCPDASDFSAFFLTAPPSAAPKTDPPTRERCDDVVCWADLSIESLDCAVYVYPLQVLKADGADDDLNALQSISPSKVTVSRSGPLTTGPDLTGGTQVGGYVWSITFSSDVWRDPTVEHPDDGDFDGNWVGSAADWDDAWSTGVSMEWGKNTGDMPSISCVDSGLYSSNGALSSDGCLVEEFLKGTEPVGGYFAVSLDTTGHSVINRQDAMPNVGDITVTRSAVNEGGNNGGFTWTVTFLRDAGSNGYGQFGDCEQRGTVDNLCNSPGDTDGVRGGLEWRVAFLENPGSYDGYTYPPGAGNLDSITYDTSNLQGTTPAVVNEVLRTGSTPFSGTFSVAFNGAKTEEMERQEATDEVEYVIEKLDTIGEIRVEGQRHEGEAYRVSLLDPSGTTFNLTSPATDEARIFLGTPKTAAKVTRPRRRGTSATSEVFCEEETGYCSSGGRLDFSGSMESKLEALDELIDAGASRYGPDDTNGFAWFWQAGETYSDCTGVSHVVPSDGSGLQNGLLYYTRVTAINSVGYSLPQATDSAMKPVTTPGAPTSVVLSTVSATQLRVQFSSPAWDGGGHEITSYLVEYAMDVAFASTESVTEYVRVSAGNIQGYGTPQSTAPSSAAPYEESGAPSDVELGITSDSMLTIGHAYPPDGGDDDVSSYRDVDGSGWFYSGEPAYALSIGGVGNLSACAEWEHPCSTRRRSECLAWDAEEYEVDEQNDLFMSEFLDVADGVTGTRKTGVANAPSGYAYSLVGVSQPPTIYVDESNRSAALQRRQRRARVADVVSAGALLPLGSRDDATAAGQTTRRPRATRTSSDRVH